ncbi:DUF3040 domain-containing protein [Pseudonocardia kunmingensis]|uniref:DUF3040 family protein n=1 Tax=Pseudonocardia kunmingensis TaxID=630975 RepID=A0A543DR46_9PSEU|nr:DUF3040 domain-containing protein [Pseudonocardia kunmingensis]TQM11800.1 DUF3040 family protein [Pseudonocardia kunmingensis]
MLSDREREALREVERRILDEDPGFARAFEARARRLPRGSAGRVGATFLLVVGVLLSAVVVLAGSWGIALALALAIALAWLVLRFEDAGPPRWPA